MIRLSLNLPTRYRLDLSLVKRRKNDVVEPILPPIKGLFNIRKGSRLSRFFRYIFEHKAIKKILGANIALMIVAASYMPGGNTSLTEGSADNTVAEAPIVINTEQGVQYPVDVIKITQGYKFYHPALDLDGITGDIVRPIMAGTVEAIQYSRWAYGNAVYLDHGNGMSSLYAHLSKINVIEGQKVDIHTELGEMGATGHAYGDHLHLEVRENGRSINPLLILPR